LSLINFDERFADYLHDWMTEHASEYLDMDAMERDADSVYLRFINTPADWLDGVSPGAYFSQYDDAKVLVDWMTDYTRQGIPVPALLLDRIAEVGLPCQKRLTALLKDENAPSEARMTAVGLLREMDSDAPKTMYIQWLKEMDEGNELTENALESLRQMGPAAVKQLTEVIGHATPAGQEAMLDVLVNYPGNEKVFRITMERFINCPEKRAIFAGYLGKLGDARALEALTQAAENADVPYLDYIELRSAIERLGGDAPTRDFGNDLGFNATGSLS